MGRAFASAAKAIIKSGIGRAILQIIACANPAAAITCPAAAAGLTLAAGGSIKQAFIAAIISFAQVGVSNGGVIDVWGIVGDAVQASGTGVVGTALSHGVISGAISVAQGGSFTSGFIAGAVSGGVGGILGRARQSRSVRRDRHSRRYCQHVSWRQVRQWRDHGGVRGYV